MSDGIPILAVFAIGALLLATVAGGLLFAVFRKSKQSSGKRASAHGEPRPDGKRRAIEIVSQNPANASGYKCRKCGATVDSTAEVSADGKVHCNYCNEWSGIL